jgi:phosphoserine aminotransferase
VISLNPGPSQLSDATIADIAAVAASGLLSRSHRSAAFVEVSRAAFGGLRERLAIPDDHRILYQPSATAAMDAVLRNCVTARSFHFVHGAFSRRFHRSAADLGIEAEAFESEGGRAVAWRRAEPRAGTELVAVTHNETSTGLMWPAEEIAGLRAAWPEPLLAVDVTSSIAGMAMRWTDADLWFASVQKCLGLPSGMGLLVVGPRAFERARSLAAYVSAWQRFADMAQKMEGWQTVETPNILAIALLARQMKRWDLERIERDTRDKAALIYGASLPWRPYVEDEAWRSITVGCFRVDDPSRYAERASKAGFLLGSGYGDLKPTTVRVANFPAIRRTQLERLIAALSPGEATDVTWIREGEPRK